jgi:DNA-binding Lrp family transcriptional regulator
MRHWECKECEYRQKGDNPPDICPLCGESAESFVEIQPIELDQTDRLLLNALQSSIPLVDRPFQAIGEALGLKEDETIERIKRMKATAIRQISAIFDSRSLGYRSTLVAFEFAPDRLEEGAMVVSRHPGVSHNYRRNHRFNLWFTLTFPGNASLEKEVGRLRMKSGALQSILLPTIRLFKIGVKLDATGEESLTRKESGKIVQGFHEASILSDREIQAVRALQRDLPLTDHPFEALSSKWGEGLSQDDLFDMGRSFMERGIMRRYSAVLRHRDAGFSANAMGVWIVPEDRMEEVGNHIAQYAAVSHCYQRPSYPPDWPYNLFSMVHGRTVEDCETVLKDIAMSTGLNEYARLYSTWEYKKVRVKYFTWTPEEVN